MVLAHSEGCHRAKIILCSIFMHFGPKFREIWVKIVSKAIYLFIKTQKICTKGQNLKNLGIWTSSSNILKWLFQKILTLKINSESTVNRGVFAQGGVKLHNM